MAVIKNKFLTAYHTDINFTPLYQWSTTGFMISMLAKKYNRKREPRAPNTNDNSIIDPELEKVNNNRPHNVYPNTSIHNNFGVPVQNKIVKDYVAIIDKDYNGIDEGYRTIILPFIPRELDYRCESTFVAIGPIGRNNPFYHFTGSEDRLEFEIDWCSFDEGRKDVITNCRRIEALSKADGYRSSPHKVMLKWSRDEILFQDHLFIVLDASYRLVQFNKSQLNKSGNLDYTSMLPVQAYQKIVLGRITEKNLTKLEIEKVGEL